MENSDKFQSLIIFKKIQANINLKLFFQDRKLTNGGGKTCEIKKIFLILSGFLPIDCFPFRSRESGSAPKNLTTLFYIINIRKMDKFAPAKTCLRLLQVSFKCNGYA